ncbi:MAG: tetratricopeptide repeat protein [Thermodesulfobacteriota bacterium]|nr:tetratricopeptide repeat protein [Thermodesulfobacteriota bacterium]
MFKTPAIYNNLAVVYSLLNQNKKAKEMWKKSLSLMNKNQIKDIE